ncbi:MAG: acyltransferase [Pseudomonadaceae bacterium]|nr:acyltransferase [Pseudomonadaceae bacterium]
MIQVLPSPKPMKPLGSPVEKLAGCTLKNIGKPDGTGPKTSFVGIDILRFLAAVMVMLVHFTLPLRSVPPELESYQIQLDYNQYPAMEGMTWFGWVGVQVFFVISGFVIAFSAKGSSPFSFLRSRVLRLLPAVWLCAPLTAMALLANGTALADVTKILVKGLLFIPTYPYIDPSYWTLGIEIVFYAVIWFTMLAAGLRRVGLVVGLIGGISALLWLLVGAGLWLQPVGWQPWLELFNTRPFQLALVTHGANFMTGVLLYVILLERSSYGLMALFVLGVVGSLAQIIAETTLKASLLAHAPLLPALVWGLALFVMVASIMLNHYVSAGWAARARRVGLLTYPLYLVHQIVGYILLSVFRQMGLGNIVSLILAIMVVVLLAVMVSEVLEPRLRRIMRHWVDNMERGLTHPMLRRLFVMQGS